MEDIIFYTEIKINKLKNMNKQSNIKTIDWLVVATEFYYVEVDWG